MRILNLNWYSVNMIAYRIFTDFELNFVFVLLKEQQ